MKEIEDMKLLTILSVSLLMLFTSISRANETFDVVNTKYVCTLNTINTLKTLYAEKNTVGEGEKLLQKSISNRNCFIINNGPVSYIIEKVIGLPTKDFLGNFVYIVKLGEVFNKNWYTFAWPDINTTLLNPEEV